MSKADTFKWIARQDWIQNCSVKMEFMDTYLNDMKGLGKIIEVQVDEQDVFKFRLGDEVKIEEIDRSGRVKSIELDSMGVKYMVRYFDNAKAYIEQFYEDELTLMRRMA